MNSNAIKSEEKRLASLRQRKLEFKSKEQLVKEALKNVDTINKSKKIVFDDEILQEYESDKVIVKSSGDKKRKILLNDDEDGDEESTFNWEKECSKEQGKATEKLIKLQSRFGNDERFKLDERFLEDEDFNGNRDEEISKEETSITDLKDEKEWQLNILQEVLRKPIRTTEPSDHKTIKKKNKMVRYDPTASGHEEFEIPPEKSEKPEKKKRKISETKEEPEPVPTSNEIFFQVSDNLTDALKPAEGFSLLRALGREETEEQKVPDLSKSNGNVLGAKPKPFSNQRNPFKYDSSDDEDTEDHGNVVKSTSIIFDKQEETNRYDDCFFFKTNDPRFAEAEEFFKKQSSENGEDFKTLRRTLKQIVRTKVRNNVRKTAVWNRKKKVVKPQGKKKR